LLHRIHFYLEEIAGNQGKELGRDRIGTNQEQMKTYYIFFLLTAFASQRYRTQIIDDPTTYNQINEKRTSSSGHAILDLFSLESK
jgi:hypothetical protein